MCLYTMSLLIHTQNGLTWHQFCVGSRIVVSFCVPFLLIGQRFASIQENPPPPTTTGEPGLWSFLLLYGERQAEDEAGSTLSIFEKIFSGANLSDLLSNPPIQALVSADEITEQGRNGVFYHWTPTQMCNFLAILTTLAAPSSFKGVAGHYQTADMLWNHLERFNGNGNSRGQPKIRICRCPHSMCDQWAFDHREILPSCPGHQESTCHDKGPLGLLKFPDVRFQSMVTEFQMPPELSSLSVNNPTATLSEIV
jgi:hypothetical protein